MELLISQDRYSINLQQEIWIVIATQSDLLTIKKYAPVNVTLRREHQRARLNECGYPRPNCHDRSKEAKQTAKNPGDSFVSDTNTCTIPAQMFAKCTNSAIEINATAGLARMRPAMCPRRHHRPQTIAVLRSPGHSLFRQPTTIPTHPIAAARKANYATQPGFSPDWKLVRPKITG